MNVRIVRSPCDIALSPEWLKTARLARSSASRRMSLHRTTSRRSAWRREPQPRAIGQPGNMGSVLAGDTIVGDREPRRFVDDKRVRVGAEAGVVVERGQRRCRRAPRRQGRSGRCASVRRISPVPERIGSRSSVGRPRTARNRAPGAVSARAAFTRRGQRAGRRRRRSRSSRSAAGRRPAPRC